MTVRGNKQQLQEIVGMAIYNKKYTANLPSPLDIQRDLSIYKDKFDAADLFQDMGDDSGDKKKRKLLDIEDHAWLSDFTLCLEFVSVNAPKAQNCEQLMGTCQL